MDLKANQGTQKSPQKTFRRIIVGQAEAQCRILWLGFKLERGSRDLGGDLLQADFGSIDQHA